MSGDGTYTAVLDRFEATRDDDELAVLLLEVDDETVDELAVDPGRLPDEGQHVDAVFEVTVEDGELRTASYRAEATERRGETAQSRFDRLSQRPEDNEDQVDD